MSAIYLLSYTLGMLQQTIAGSFRIFRLVGINVYLHWTWFILAYLAWQYRSDYPNKFWNLLEYAAVFALVLTHEFGHALACRSVGGRAEHIVLWPLGGVAFVQPPQRPGPVLWSIAAGPLVNVLLIPVLFMAVMAMGVPLQFDQLRAPGGAEQFILAVFVINIMLLCFNLLPVYPLDGGQILQALLWFVVGRALSLRIVTFIGIVVAVAGGIVALVVGRFWLVVLAVFIVVTVSPIVDFLAVRLRFPPGVAILTAVLCALGILAVLSLLLILASLGVVETAKGYSESFTDLTDRAFAKLDEWQIDVDQVNISAELQSKLPAVATQTVSTATGLLSNGVLIFIFVVFLLAGRTTGSALPGVYAEIESKIRRYITTKLILSAVTGLLVWIVLALFGLPMAPLFGMLAFLLNFIPSIGSVIATLLPLPIAVAEFGGDFWMIAGAVAVPGAIQMGIGNVLEPKLMGQGLELHPVTILLALAFWGLIWGVVGMLLATPITASIRIVLIRFDTTRPLGDLLAGKLPGADGKASEA